MSEISPDALTTTTMYVSDPWIMTVKSDTGDSYEQLTVPMFRDNTLTRAAVATFTPTCNFIAVSAVLESPFGDKFTTEMLAKMTKGDSLTITWVIK